MIIGVGLDGPRLNLNYRELNEMGREAARLGFESIWTPAGGLPDSFHLCGAWADASNEVLGHPIRTGISVIPAPRNWRPSSLALQAATVAIRSNGKFVLGLGTGGAGAEFFASAGLPNRPIGVMRDLVVILRGLLAGETVTYSGSAISVERLSIGQGFPTAPVYLAALGPHMLRLVGEVADGACLNWATPRQVADSRMAIAAGAAEAGREMKDIVLSMYIRMCIDDDVDAARKALGTQVLSYAMARPGADRTRSYRGQFARMGFDEVLRDLEARRDSGTPMSDLVDKAPDELLQAVGYFGSAAGAPAAFARLSAGLDEALVRIVTARPGTAPVFATMEALTPALIRAA